ncbi:hypothetical protein SAMN05660880_03698 [Luteibacter sp. 22Crub2.1]|nr:hypothetical protein SAMN05660880_03698 [Luteibacter sp. 22Crub2.1]
MKLRQIKRNYRCGQGRWQWLDVAALKRHCAMGRLIKWSAGSRMPFIVGSETLV